jgi:CRP-like cAMP-binding protein
MPTLERTTNHLLAALNERDRELLLSEMERVTLPIHKQIEVAGRPLEWLYFLDSGIASVIAESSGGHQVESGIIGSEGFTGVSVALGDAHSAQLVVMQISGAGMRISAAKFQAALVQSSQLRERSLLFARAFMIQAAHTALANGAGLLEQRLARWLLMLHDRVDGDTLAITHDYIATMLSVRRPGVSVALKVLEEQGLIRVNRGLIAVVDRAGLLRKSDGLYGRTEAEYERLLHWRSPKQDR